MSRVTPALLLAGLVLPGLTPGARLAADWPEFRGPTGQGLSKETRLPLEWGPAKNVGWKKAIPGSGWSSPVVAGGKVYLTSAIPAPPGRRLALSALCLDAKDGRTLWTTEVFRQDAT